MQSLVSTKELIEAVGKRSRDAILNRPYDFSHVSLRKSHKIIRKTAD